MVKSRQLRINLSSTKVLVVHKHDLHLITPQVITLNGDTARITISGGFTSPKSKLDELSLQMAFAIIEGDTGAALAAADHVREEYTGEDTETTRLMREIIELREEVKDLQDELYHYKTTRYIPSSLADNS